MTAQRVASVTTLSSRAWPLISLRPPLVKASWEMAAGDGKQMMLRILTDLEPSVIVQSCPSLHLVCSVECCHPRQLQHVLFFPPEDTVPKKAVCHFGGKAYADEERWDIDSCTHCYCLQGQTLCSTVSCPPLPCVEPINVEGSCCPMCPGIQSPSFHCPGAVLISDPEAARSAVRSS